MPRATDPVKRVFSHITEAPVLGGYGVDDRSRHAARDVARRRVYGSGAGRLMVRVSTHRAQEVVVRAIRMPSVCMRDCTVERFMPRMAAAPLGPATIQLAFSSAPRICCRSTSSRAARIFC